MEGDSALSSKIDAGRRGPTICGRSGEGDSDAAKNFTAEHSGWNWPLIAARFESLRQQLNEGVGKGDAHESISAFFCSFFFFFLLLMPTNAFAFFPHCTGPRRLPSSLPLSLFSSLPLFSLFLSLSLSLPKFLFPFLPSRSGDLLFSLYPIDPRSTAFPVSELLNISR